MNPTILTAHERLRKTARGFVRAFSFEPATGQIIQVVEQPNLVVYAGANLMGKLLAGQAPAGVNMMYLEFENIDGVVSPLSAPALTDTAQSVRSAQTGDYDLLRLALRVNPSLTATDEAFATNRVTFFCVTTGTEGYMNTVPFTAGDHSQVYGGCLIAALDEDDDAEDVLFSRVTFDSAIAKGATAQIGVQWTIDFPLTEA